jgi:hypothetical protein
LTSLAWPSRKRKKRPSDMSQIRPHYGVARSESGAEVSSGHGNRLPFVKREYKVGPATYLDPIYGVPRWIAFPATSYRCPHCGHLLHADFWSGNVRLGPGALRCASCGENYDDGSREWPELSLRSKLRFCCPPILAAIIGGLILADIFSLFLPQLDWRVTIFGLALTCFPLFLFLLVRLPWILLSIRRYNERRETRAA